MSSEINNNKMSWDLQALFCGRGDRYWRGKWRGWRSGWKVV